MRGSGNEIFCLPLALVVLLGLNVRDVLGGLPSNDDIPYCNCKRKCHGEKKRFEIIISHPLSWQDALIYCKERRMELATIRNSQEHDKILEELKRAGMENGEKSRMFWIGGTKLHSNRGFFWMSEGDQVQYTNWLRGQPDDYAGSQKCMTYQHGWMDDIRWAWDDNYCSSALSFACEYC
ncbi:hypothetical protein GE061_017840 [Apolygus lucorum]|uniref:C-type lectin domain-containing protein n=1 Tax=Apolygus lucorum TaxID=248454 RepID=A0A8S9XDJ4_APOLU|nr:hypothetical protein GE061_017840 [Apolygus lucorum]